MINDTDININFVIDNLYLANKALSNLFPMFETLGLDGFSVDYQKMAEDTKRCLELFAELKQERMDKGIWDYRY
jgi:hypothetical protein